MNVLMIGNSFSICVGKNLPQIVRAGKKHQLSLTSAYIGGCSLETHANHLKNAEKDISITPYLITVWNSQDARTGGKRRGNVLELLKNNKYDVISIQQASHLSWNYSSYQPYADVIISYIRKFNPQAKIIIQQTWSYRNDAPKFAEWGFDSDEMYKRARNAYRSFAADQKFDIIPTGDAVDIYRKNSRRIFKALSEKELAKYRYPDLPPVADDIVGVFFWHKMDDGSMKLCSDTIHLNYRGEYLQACVWYGKLFNEDPENIVWEHPKISSEECRAMRSAAKAALG